MKSFASPRVRHVLAALAVTSIASGVANAGSSVPFNATIAVQENLIGMNAPECTLISDVSGTGTASHLGKVTLHATDCINPVGATTLKFVSNTPVVLTAANGDQVRATYSGFVSIEGASELITGAFVITGGTGRFAQATGAGTLQGVEDATGQGQIELTGTISY